MNLGGTHFGPSHGAKDAYRAESMGRVHVGSEPGTCMGKGPSPHSGGRGWPTSSSYTSPPQAPNASVLVFFHNTVEARDGEGSLTLDGSFLAATGNLIVVTAGYRVGVFGFLSSGEWLASVGTAGPRAEARSGCAQPQASSFGVPAERTGGRASSMLKGPPGVLAPTHKAVVALVELCV